MVEPTSASVVETPISAPQEPEILNPRTMDPPLNEVLITDLAGLQQVESFLASLVDGECIGLDLETNVTESFFDRRIRTIQLGNKAVQYVIDLLAFAGSTDALVASQGAYGAASDLLLGPVVRVVRKAFESRAVTKVGQGLQFEAEMLHWNLGIRIDGLFCTLLAEKNIYAGLVHFMAKGFWDLVALVKRYAGLNMAENELGKSFDLSTPLTPKQIEYCALDVRLPLAVRIGQRRILEAEGLAFAAQIDFDAIPAFGDMHLNGVYLAPEPWRALLADVMANKAKVVEAMDRLLIPVVGRKGVSDLEKQRLAELEKKWRMCGSKTLTEKRVRASFRKEFMVLRKSIADRTKEGGKCEGEAFLNYGAPKQLQNALLKLGIPKKDLPNTKDDTLKQLAKYPKLTLQKAFETCEGLTSNASGTLLKLPIVDLLRLHRSLDKSLTTYGETWVMSTDERDAEGNYGNVNPGTGRIHSNINQFGAATGRSTSSAPNIQNIPRGSAYRRCFTARPGYKLLTIDYNGCELRIMAELSGEQEWISAFLKGWDVHSVGAEILYGKIWKDGAEPGCKYYSEHDKCKCAVHKELRGYVKAVNFGIAYGKGAASLAEELDITKEKAEELLIRYRASFPTITKFLEELGRSAKTVLETRTIAGRRRRWLMPKWDRAKLLVEKDLNKNSKKKKKGEEEKPGEWKTATTQQISKKLKGMFASIEREGKNCPIQGTNADIAKIAMYMIWQKLSEFGAFFFNFVHDELVIECPEETADACYQFCSTTMTAAGAVLVKKIEMTTEGGIAFEWNK